MPQITIYKCSGCAYMSSLSSMLKRHVEDSKGCRGCPIVSKEFDLQFDDVVETRRVPVPREKPGPKVPDMTDVLRGRIPYDEIDERKEHACNELVETFFAKRRPLPQFLAMLFSKLWGINAPPKFKSIVYKDPRVFFVTCTEEEDDEIFTTVDSERYSKRFVRGLVKIVMSVAEEFCDEFSEEHPAAGSTLRDIRQTPSGVGIENVLDRDQTFEDKRASLGSLKKLADDITASLEHALSGCNA